MRARLEANTSSAFGVEMALETTSESVYERVQERFETFTRAEKQLANSLLENWPVSGLSSITTVAKNADVSTPTVARMVQKLGFTGFPSFQAALRDDLEEKISNPIVKHDRWSTSAPDTHVLNAFADSVLQNLRQTLSRIEPNEFDQICALIADPDRAIFVAGGRITHTLAEYFFLHLQMIRPQVTVVPCADNTWPHHVMNMNEGDVLVVFDIRRYQNDLLKLAEIASEKGIELILITDQWGSPVARKARYNINCRIEAPSAWDSNAVLMVVIETMIASIQDNTWPTTSSRMEDLEELFDKTRLFRKFK